jgi:MFS family permease
LVAAADLGPMIFIAPFGGAYVDRADPVKIIKGCMAFMQFQALLLAVLTGTGAITIELLFVLSLITGCVQPIYSAARQTLVPSMVPREDFATGVALDSSFFHGSRFLGPSIAALTIPWFGVQSNFVAHVFGTGILQVMLWRLKFPAPDRSRRRHGSLLRDVRDGIAYVGTHPGLMPVFVLVTVVSTAIRPVQDMLSGFAGSVFHAGAVGLAVLTSSLGAGALVSAVTLAVRGQMAGLTHKVFFACLGLSAATFLFISSTSLWVGVIAGFLIGYTLNSVSTGAQTLAQIAVTDDLRGRVSGLYSVVYRGTPAIGALVTGFLAEWIGLRWSFVICAAIGLGTFVYFLPRIGAIAAALEHHRATD